RGAEPRPSTQSRRRARFGDSVGGKCAPLPTRTRGCARTGRSSYRACQGAWFSRTPASGSGTQGLGDDQAWPDGGGGRQVGGGCRLFPAIRRPVQSILAEVYARVGRTDEALLQL